VQATSPDTAEHVDTCLAREILDRIGDKWSVYVIDALAAGTRRFSELRRDVDGVSQRMLTVTLRALERDGLITRQVYPVIPPRVDYALTPLGRSLLAIVEALVAWSADHINDVERARDRYDTSQRAGWRCPRQRDR
jgi:DNA-binding HxlR family transcriptional regulator